MTARPSPTILRFAHAGARVRSATVALEREAPRLIAALRRSVPFLSRRGVPITLASVRVETFDEVTGPLERPMHVTRFTTTPGPGAGAMVFDAAASGFLLDGVLGGSGTGSPPELNPTGLSGPQAALLSGLASNILRAFSTSLNAGLGIGLDGRAAPSPASADAVSLACELAVETPHGTARIVLVIPADALATRTSAPEPEAMGDPRVAKIMVDVEVDLVVELGRVSLPIGRMASLAVGDTLRLDVPVAGLVSIRAGDQELLQGRPTSSAGRIAVKIVTSEGARHAS